MPNRPPRPCAEPGCPNNCEYPERFCSDHKKDNLEHKLKVASQDPRYNTKEWKIDFMGHLCGDNPFCQRVINGFRCTRKANTGHHILGTYFNGKDIFFDQTYIVATCDGCHPRPAHRDQGVFLPTRWHIFMCPEPPYVEVAPGAEVPSKIVLWNIVERTKHFEEAEAPRKKFIGG